MKGKLLVLLFCLGLFSVGLYFRLDKTEERPTTSNEMYLQFCREAVANEEVFKAFKRDPLYTLFEEGVSFEEGVALLKIIQRQTPELLAPNLLERVRRLDCYGRPHVHNFAEVGPFSPTTILYLKIASDLKKIFGELEHLNVIEIASGSGGLCKVLHEVFDIEQYTIVDQKEKLALSRRHLDLLGLEHVQCLSPEELKLLPCDLLISYEGISSANKALQGRYIKKLVPGAERGYLICNFYPHHFGLKGLKKQKLIKKIAHYQEMAILPEEPRTGKENCIMTWKDQDAF